MATMSPVVHFEMGYDDGARMAGFYEQVFGWKTQQTGPEMGNYIVAHTTETSEDGMIQTKGAINGGFYQKTDDRTTEVPSIVVAVDDIQATLQAVEAAGGKNLGTRNAAGERTFEPQMIPGVGLWISILDTEGNRLSLLQR